ncbi:MAG: macro domain-containing protein [Butyrivibrio sp.]|nr:macro domain-containing protein [Butyrivibrio sp.]
MSNIVLIQESSVNQNVDAIVNAANPHLLQGGGVCGAIFSSAGSSELAKECSKYKTPLKDGSAVITSSCRMKNCKAIIHAVGPDFRVRKDAFKELSDAYYNSLKVLKDNGYHSISFPLISSGIFAGDLEHPVAESTKQCKRAYKKFTEDYPDYDIDVKLCVYSPRHWDEAKTEFDR